MIVALFCFGPEVLWRFSRMDLFLPACRLTTRERKSLCGVFSSETTKNDILLSDIPIFQNLIKTLKFLINVNEIEEVFERIEACGKSSGNLL